MHRRRSERQQYRRSGKSSAFDQHHRLHDACSGSA
jgi:hypothetical protein